MNSTSSAVTRQSQPIILGSTHSYHITPDTVPRGKITGDTTPVPSVNKL